MAVQNDTAPSHLVLLLQLFCVQRVDVELCHITMRLGFSAPPSHNRLSFSIQAPETRFSYLQTHASYGRGHVSLLADFDTFTQNRLVTYPLPPRPSSSPLLGPETVVLGR
jgi:hypothetical protein